MPAITNVTELQAMNNDLAGTYWLANDIDASATSGWNGGLGFEPIGNTGDADPFTGSLDGRGYTISDLYIDRDVKRAAPDVYSIGLFGEISGAVVRNVEMTGLDFTGFDGGGAGTIGKTGGLVARVVNSTISNCHVAGVISSYGDATGFAPSIDADSTVVDCTADVACTSTANDAAGFCNWNNGTISNCSSTGNATADDYASGFANGNNGTISGSFSTGSVSSGWGLCGGFVGDNSGVISESYATGNVSAPTRDNVGGFCGYNDGTINDCYARGNVVGDDDIGGFVGENDGGSITDCFSTGTVTGDVNVGGFCGHNDGGTVTDCFWDTTTSGEAASDGGTGKTTSQMQTRATFTGAGWDFTIIWSINDVTNDGYPFHFVMPPEPTPDSPRETVLVEEKITLESIRNVEMAAGGRFYINAEGKAVYKSRYARNP